MDRHFAGKAVTARFLGLAAQRRGIAEVDRDGIDGLHPRRRGAGKAKRAREPVGVEEAAVAVAVRLRAELGRKVFGSPGQPLEPGARPTIGTGEKQRGRGLGRDRHDLDRTLGQACDRLARQKLRIGTNDIGAAFCLRQHDGVGTRGHDRVEIGVGKTGRKSVDANQEARAARSFDRALDEGRCPHACIGLALRGNRIFEIDDHRVGAARHRLVELFCVIGRDKKQRTHHRGRMRMKTWRRHSATSLLS